MTRVQPNSQWAYLCGKGDDDGRPYTALIDADGALITVGGGGGEVDASDVTYTPAVVADWDGGVDPGNQDAADDQLAERIKDIEEYNIPANYPIRAEIHHRFDYIVAGNVFTEYAGASNLGSYVSYQNAAVNGDNFRNSAFLSDGEYTLAVIGLTSNWYGKLDIQFKHKDDAGWTSIVVGQDWYSASLVANVAKTASFTVVSPGRQIFDYKVNGKNAASTGYAMFLAGVIIYPTNGDA